MVYALLHTFGAKRGTCTRNAQREKKQLESRMVWQFAEFLFEHEFASWGVTSVFN